MELGLPEEDSEQSREGKLLHDYDEHPEYDRRMLRPEQQDLLERNRTLQNFIAERVRHAIQQPEYEGGDLRRDTRLENGLISGTPDLIVGYPRQSAVWINDSKFGYKIVERAETNLQLRTYAVLIYDFLDKTPKRIFVSITQPRLAYSERVTLAEYKPEDILEAAREISLILVEAAKPDAPLIAGEEQCRYCRAKMICPEFQSKMLVPIEQIRPELALSKAAREAYFEQQIAQRSDDQVEQLLLARSLMKMIDSPLLNEARKRIAHEKLTNYFLTKPITRREIMDSQRAIALLSLGKVATRDEILAMSSIPLSQLEEAYRKRTGCTWGEAREKINKVLQSVIETHEEKPQVRRK